METLITWRLLLAPPLATAAGKFPAARKHNGVIALSVVANQLMYIYYNMQKIPLCTHNNEPNLLEDW